MVAIAWGGGASDGTFDSNVVNFTVSPPPGTAPAGAPTLTPSNLQEVSGEQPVPLSTLLVYNDPAEAPPLLWRVQDVATDGTQARSCSMVPRWTLRAPSH